MINLQDKEGQIVVVTAWGGKAKGKYQCRVTQVTENWSPTTLDKSETQKGLNICVFMELPHWERHQAAPGLQPHSFKFKGKKASQEPDKKGVHGQVWVMWPPWSSSQEHCHPRFMDWVGEGEEIQALSPEGRTDAQQTRRISTTSNRSHKWGLGTQKCGWKVRKSDVWV